MEKNAIGVCSVAKRGTEYDHYTCLHDKAFYDHRVVTENGADRHQVEIDYHGDFVWINVLPSELKFFYNERRG